MNRKVLLVGLDCAPPLWVLDRWIDDLPHLKLLARTGISGRLESTIPPITVPAWMSMMTGRDPGVLGVYGFRNRKDYTYTGLAFASSRLIREPAVWDLCARQQKKVALLGIPLTYPPRPVNGIMVSGFPVPAGQSDFTFPAHFKTEIDRIAPDYQVDVPEFRTDKRDDLIQQIYAMTDARFKLASVLMREQPWDFFAIVEMGPDRLQHAFWSYMDPAHRKYVPGHRYENIIHDYYVHLDQAIGGLMQHAPSDTIVLVVSDHGCQKMDGGICLNEWLIQEGYLALKEYPTTITRLDPATVDWPRTRAWGDGGYYGRLFLNVQGREPEGVVPPGDYEAVRAELIQRLEAITDEAGACIGTRVFRPQELYQSTSRVPPDLVIYFGNLDWRSVGSVGHRSVWTRENDTGPDDANHAQHGMLILGSPGGDMPPLRPGSSQAMRIYDVMPTLCDLMGLEPPEGLIGRSLFGS